MLAKMKKIVAAGVIAGSAFATVPAYADTVSFTLLNPVQNISAAGGTLAYSATVLAPITNTGSEDLDGIQFNISPSNKFVFDSDPFLNNFPYSLAPGQSYTGLLFNLLVPSGSAANSYFGNIELDGGPSNTSLGIQTFSANVTPTVSAVPEPATWAMIILGMGAIGFAMRRRKDDTTRAQVA